MKVEESVPPIASSRQDRPITRGQKVIEQSAYVFAAQVFGLFCGVASNFLVAWMLGPEGKGSMYLVQLIGTLGQILLSFGLGPAAIYYLQRDRSYSESQIRSGILWSSLLLGLLPWLIYGMARHWLQGMGGAKISESLIVLGIIAIPGLVLLWNVSYLTLAKGAIAVFNFLRAGQSFLALLLLCALLIWRRYSVFMVALSWTLSVLLPAALSPLLVRAGTEGPTRPLLPFMKSAFRFGFHSHVGAVTQYLQGRVDGLLVSFFCPLQAVGLYSLAISMAELLWYLPNTVAQVLISHVAQSSDEHATHLTSSFCRVTIAITGVLALFLAGAATWLIPILLPGFRGSLPILWLLLPGAVSGTVFKVLSSDLNGRGMPAETIRPAAMALAVCTIVDLVVIPRFGILGAAIVTSGSYILNTILYLRTYSRITATSARDLLLLRLKDVSMIQQYFRDFAFRMTASTGPIQRL